MERLLAQLCGTGASQPLPLWEDDTPGHCFTQLVLSALPHALLSVLSACHWGTPRWVETACKTSARNPHLCGAVIRLGSEVPGAGQKWDEIWALPFYIK